LTSSLGGIEIPRQVKRCSKGSTSERIELLPFLRHVKTNLSLVWSPSVEE
jgi:hypothetical protein